MKKNDYIVKKINLGIEILRVILSFWIVIIHCSIIKKEHEQYVKKHFHVPTFIVLSFFFYYKVFSQRIINKIKERFQRLLIPYVLWPLIILIINNIFFSKFSLKNLSLKELIKSIFIQIIIGS